MAPVADCIILIMTCFFPVRPCSSWLATSLDAATGRSGLLFWSRPSVSAASVHITTRLYSSSSSFRNSFSQGKRNLVSLQDCLAAVQQSETADSGSRIVFVDGSWYHGEAAKSRNGRAEFEAGPRIPNARYMDMDDISTTKELFPELNPKGLGHMLPPKDLFARTMDAFDIRNSDQIVVYGREGTVFLPRTWFLFRCMGHERVSIMQGSLEEWMDMGGPMDMEATKVTTAREIMAQAESANELLPRYQAKEPTNIFSLQDMKKAVAECETVIDPRGSSFAKGHMPGAIHVPYSSLVDSDNQLVLKSKAELQQIFEEVGVDYDSRGRIIASCGSGVSVCHVLLALEECGRTGDTCMYDGSWAEWSNEPDTPKVTGPFSFTRS